MPDAQGNALPGEPGYQTPGTAATGATTGLMNTTAVPLTPSIAPAVTPYTPINQPAPAPTPVALDPSKTVAGGVEKIIAADSPLMQQATARAMAKMNERGLLNSSQAISAGQAAVLDAATPIAVQDANNATQLALAGQQAATQKYTADLSSNTQLQMQTVDNAFKTAFQTADTAAKAQLQTAHDAATKQIAEIEANYKTLMQTSQSASDTYKATLAAIANIYADSSIDAAGKANVINGYLGWMKQNMNMIGSVNGVDLTGLTDFGTVGA
jgi:hypothetical protein